MWYRVYAKHVVWETTESEIDTLQAAGAVELDPAAWETEHSEWGLAIVAGSNDVRLHINDLVICHDGTATVMRGRYEIAPTVEFFREIGHDERYCLIDRATKSGQGLEETYKGVHLANNLPPHERQIWVTKGPISLGWIRNMCEPARWDDLPYEWQRVFIRYLKGLA